MIHGSLGDMSVTFSPMMRLSRVRICLEVVSSPDEDDWMARCRESTLDGAGMLCLRGTDLDRAAHSARRVVGNALVALAEPVGADVDTDVIHLGSLDHAHNWPSRLVGCDVSSVDECRAARASGCSYVVVDIRHGSVIDYLAQLSSADLVWFVSRCSTTDDLRRAVDLGARRVWMDANHRDMVAPWSTILRRWYRADPEQSGLKRLKERLL